MGGQTVVGVLRPTSFGEPAGTMKVTDIKRSYGSQATIAASSEDAISPEEVGTQFNYLQKLTSVQTQAGVYQTDQLIRKG